MCSTEKILWLRRCSRNDRESISVKIDDFEMKSVLFLFYMLKTRILVHAMSTHNSIVAKISIIYDFMKKY